MERSNEVSGRFQKTNVWTCLGRTRGRSGRYTLKTASGQRAGGCQRASRRIPVGEDAACPGNVKEVLQTSEKCVRINMSRQEK